ncbi:hypothetical protein C0J52_27922 [Blattella germanica]|nr:hypothetical protein C0J52_27922 [Blattella germanica]
MEKTLSSRRSLRSWQVCEVCETTSFASPMYLQPSLGDPQGPREAQHHNPGILLPEVSKL